MSGQPEGERVHGGLVATASVSRSDFTLHQAGAQGMAGAAERTRRKRNRQQTDEGPPFPLVRRRSTASGLGHDTEGRLGLRSGLVEDRAALLPFIQQLDQVFQPVSALVGHGSLSENGNFGIPSPPSCCLSNPA